MRTRRLVLASCLAVAASLVPVAAGNASTSTFTFYGSGFGHGIGMSQWGAYGLAKKGWTHQQILTHYYSNTQLGQAAQPDKIRVGLVDGVQLVHLTARGGDVTIRSDSPTGSPLATIPSGATYLLKGATGTYKLVNGNGQQVATADGSKKLYATYQDAGAMLRSAEAGHTYNRGWVEFNDYQPCNGCQPRIRMIAILPPQQYLYGLGEVPSSWPAEALESQADAARSYAEYLIDALGQNRAGCNCGVYDDTRNQVYAGWDHEGENGGQAWVKAVDATAGEFVLYQGKVIDAQYMSSSGGFTENNENVWGGSAVAYLRGVCDPGDYTSSNHAAVWHSTIDADVVTSKLRPYTGDIGTIKSFGSISRGISGRIRTVKVAGTAGSKSIAGSTLRGALGLMDDRIWINNDKNVTGTIRVKYDSLSCRPGLPRSPAVSVAGGSLQRFASGAIYRNTKAAKTVWLFGDIYTKYRQMKEGASALGLPTSSVQTLVTPAGCDQAVCQKATFDGGSMFFKADTGAHELHGAVLDYLNNHGGVAGRLGFPTTDVTPAANGHTQATFQGKPGGAPIVVNCASDGTCSESSGS